MLKRNLTKTMKRITTFGMAAIMLTMFFTGCGNKDGKTTTETKDKSEAVTTPYGKYDELITYTIGKNTPGSPRLPEGDTYENNAYTRYLKDVLNVQNKDEFEAANGDPYDQKVSMSVATGDIPDIMKVDATTLKQLVDSDMIEDLTDVYKNCATDKIKQMYDSYSGRALASATFDGKLMALPSTQCANVPTMLWVRQDWIDKLGLQAPKNMDDVENILQQFVTKDPGNNGAGKTIGIVASSNVGGVYGGLFQMDNVLGMYNAFPGQWIEEDGKVVFGSTTNNMKKGLSKVAEMFKKGLIDPQMAVRQGDDVTSLIVNGQAGAFFGPWWAPDYPLNDAKKLNPNAQWVPYIIPTNADGSYTTYTQNPASEFYVVRKGFEHPELLVKIASVLNDKMVYEDYGKQELMDYIKQGVDSGAKPVGILINDYNATIDMYKNIDLALKGEKDPESLGADKGNYEKCKDYLANPSNPSADAWSGYTSRMISPKLMSETKVNEVNPVFFGQTKSMKLKWANLKKLQDETFLKIVTGEASIDSFDDFVATWKSTGGDEITKEVEEAIKK
ncbi:extracellular solute-binding protein [Clostridium beijerinckii]|uniref:ABC transporter substrate-binding protein n=1 Tax=Clostridium beijerinckii TaxID=1520 RepID=A0A1S9NBG5_CLOBE|nr:extracellular solute-binding protein [Clostridium beijerinckii]OOP74798.1 ABC transporter substrate-binding protein [Clostridium beijerinckii]